MQHGQVANGHQSSVCRSWKSEKILGEEEESDDENGYMQRPNSCHSLNPAVLYLVEACKVVIDVAENEAGENEKETNSLAA